MGCRVVLLLAASASNHLTSYETGRNARLPIAVKRSSRDISSSLRNSKAGRERRSVAPDATVASGCMKQGFPSAGYRKPPLYPENLRDMMHAVFQMRPCRDRNRQSGRRSNTTGVGAKYASQVLDRLVAQEDLGFHPALAYKYSGERGACKVVIPSEAKSRNPVE